MPLSNIPVAREQISLTARKIDQRLVMSTPRHQPFIFFSYSRFDDKHDRGRITSFAKALQDEARFRLGDEVVVFFDRSDLQHGELWDDKIRDSLEKASVFLAIVTPN